MVLKQRSCQRTIRESEERKTQELSLKPQAGAVYRKSSLVNEKSVIIARILVESRTNTKDGAKSF